MAKLPRNLDADDILKFLQKNQFAIIRQKGNHIRLQIDLEDFKYSITIPYHKPIKVGTLNNILKELTTILKVDKSDLISAIINQRKIT